MYTKRDMLKKAVGIGTFALAIPSTWTKPIINLVVLPVHGQTSGFSPSVADLCQIDNSGSSVLIDTQASFVVDGYSIIKQNSLRDGIYNITDPSSLNLGSFIFPVSLCGLPVDSIQLFNHSSGDLFITIGRGPFGPIIKINR